MVVRYKSAKRCADALFWCKKVRKKVWSKLGLRQTCSDKPLTVDANGDDDIQVILSCVQYCVAMDAAPSGNIMQRAGIGARDFQDITGL